MISSQPQQAVLLHSFLPTVDMLLLLQGLLLILRGSLQTTNNNTLTIGGDTSGELILKQSNLSLLRAPGGGRHGKSFLGLQAGSNGAGASNTAVGYQALPNFTSGAPTPPWVIKLSTQTPQGAFSPPWATKPSPQTAQGNSTPPWATLLSPQTPQAPPTPPWATLPSPQTPQGHQHRRWLSGSQRKHHRSSNTALGFNALVSNTTGTANTALGYQALFSNSSGQFNTALGYQAGYTSVAGNANAIGTNNTFLGYNSGPGSTNWLTNAAAIGSYATVTCPNCLVLGSIEGINTATASASVGIGIASPIAVLDVRGGNTGGNAALIVNQTGASANDIFTASASGTSVFKITNAGNVRTVGALCVKATMSTACAGSTAGTIYATNTTVHKPRRRC